MKKLLPIAILTLIFILNFTITRSNAKNDPLSSNGSTYAGITYIVDVDNSAVSGCCGMYYIAVTDADGNPIDQPKEYQDGITTYVFHESGSVTGTRAAMLVKASSFSQNACGMALYAAPDPLTGKFTNTSTHYFNLTVVNLPGND